MARPPLPCGAGFRTVTTSPHGDRTAQPGDPGLAVPAFTAALSRAPAPLEYPRHFLVKTINCAGTFRFRDRLLYLANALVDQPISLEETDDGIWAIHLGTVLLATFDERDYIIRG